MDCWKIVFELCLISLLPWPTSAATDTIIGNRAGCTEEGEIVPAKRINIKDLSCFTCVCKNGFVECQKARCFEEVGCYMLGEREEGMCCRQCRGCVHLGVHRRSGDTWRDPDHPCLMHTCHAGVVTSSMEVCGHSQCSPAPVNNSTLASSTCCHSCRGCFLSGQRVGEGREVTSADDPCLKCRCSGGLLSCVKRACPVLQCPRSQMVHPTGECCPVCVGNRSLLPSTPGTCILKTKMLESGGTMVLDACTNCTCMNGTSVCKRTTCPVLSCPTEMQTHPHGECCPQCPDVLESRSVCSFDSKIYEEGEDWQLDACSSCTCRNGAPRCLRVTCPSSSCAAPHRWEQVPGECCPRCVEPDGVCTVFGDPHYRTFDGKFFSFQGSCKYLLAADCVGRSFTIRVKNDGRLTDSWAWTKTVSLKIGDLKVNLGQKMRVKINGERIVPPYSRGNEVSVEMTEGGESVLVKTDFGLKLLWNGNSFLEVSVPTVYKNRMCGLCGNYNGLPRDDLRTRQGKPTNDTVLLGASWRVGGKRACDRPRDYDVISGKHQRKSTTACAKMSKRKAEAPCTFIKHNVFEACRAKVNHHLYLKACTMDMCECTGGLCYCEALTAYAHECARLGVSVAGWQKKLGCPSAWTSKALAILHNTIEPLPLIKHSKKPRRRPRPTWAHFTRPPYLGNGTKRPPPPLIH